jgi:competence protein ComEA
VGAVLSIPREHLLRQLAGGRVELSVDLVRAQLPAGMCAPDAQGTLVFDLATVVAALPPELLQTSGDLDPEAKAVVVMGNLFSAALPPPPAPPPPGLPETISLPCSAVLGALPAAWRGAAWRATDFPDIRFDLPRVDLLRQLAGGSVAVSLSLLQGKLPLGWVAENAAGNVVLNLADVVAAVPPECMAVQEDLADDVVAAAQLGRLFAPALPPPPVAPSAVIPVAAAPAPVVPLPRPAAPRPAEPLPDEPRRPAVTVMSASAVAVLPSAPPLPSGLDTDELPEQPLPLSTPAEAADADGITTSPLPSWNGVEGSLERAPRGIDLNVARAAELMLLPGVGASRAQAIVAARTARGSFDSIYDLAAVPGVGPAVFRRMTGLSPQNRADRHAVMEHYLTLPADSRPLLERIVEAIRAEMGAAGAVLTNLEGMPLAVSGGVPEAHRYAALGSRFFFRTRRHLQRFVDRASDCIILPGSTPPLLLLSSEDVVVILTLTGSAVLQKRLTRARRAMREVGWLLSRRAVVLHV